MEYVPKPNPTFDDVLQSTEITGDFRRSNKAVNEKLHANELDEEAREEACGSLQELLGLEYLGQESKVSGMLYLYDVERGEVDTLSAPSMVSNLASTFEGVVIGRDDMARLSVLLRFSTPAADGELGQSYAARYEDVTRFMAAPEEYGESDTEAQRYEAFQNLHDTFVGVFQSQEYQGASHALQTEMIDDLTIQTDSRLRELLKDFSARSESNPYVTMESSVFFELSTTDADTIDWKRAKRDQRKREERSIVEGEYRGVIVPREHPACKQLPEGKGALALRSAPHIVVDYRDDETFALVPLVHIEHIQGM